MGGDCVHAFFGGGGAYHPRISIIGEKWRFDMSRGRSSHRIQPRVDSPTIIDVEILHKFLLRNGEVSAGNRRRPLRRRREQGRAGNRH